MFLYLLFSFQGITVHGVTSLTGEIVNTKLMFGELIYNTANYWKRER